MRLAVFYSMFMALSLIGVTFLLTWLHPRFRIWPPPSRRSWQFYFVWILIDYCYLAFIVTGILDWNSGLPGHWLRFPLGMALMLGGVALIAWAMTTLTYLTSLGLGGKFVQTGPYRFTRNPQYLGFAILIIGYAILSNSWMVWLCGSLGIVLFGLAPLLEEPWLEERYGELYRDYKRTVPRFLGTRRKTKAQ